MEHELFWGMILVMYLFLGGMGAGATVVSAWMLLRGGGGVHFEIARYGALLGPWPVIIGTGLNIIELGSWQVGNYFRFLNLFLTLTLSPMSIGSWLLMLFTGISLVYAYTYIRPLPWPSALGDKDAWRRGLAWVIIPIGLGVCVYPGVMLGAMPSRPLWNSPMLPVLFLISALTTGAALIILARAVIPRSRLNEEETEVPQKSGFALTSTVAMLIGFELLAVILFLLFAYLTVDDVRIAVGETILPGGELAGLFWIGFVLVGMILPVLIELGNRLPNILYHKGYRVSALTEIVVASAVILGGVLLRYIIVVGGQITGPVGI